VPETRHSVGLSSLKEDIHRPQVGQVKWCWLQSLAVTNEQALSILYVTLSIVISYTDNVCTAWSYWGAASYLRHTCTEVRQFQFPPRRLGDL
jgi:hypothetical protein